MKSSSFDSASSAAGHTAAGLWEAMDKIRTTFEQKASMRMGRGDVRAGIIALLAEQPMHGYQIMAEIEERSGGAWKPSAGSVYPTLQLLSDEGLITAEESNGRKVYALTGAGHAEADASADTPAPWETPMSQRMGAQAQIPKAGIELAQVAAQVARTGTPEQMTEAAEVLDDARRRLYSILAQG